MNQCINDEKNNFLHFLIETKNFVFHNVRSANSNRLFSSLLLIQLFVVHLASLACDLVLHNMPNRLSLSYLGQSGKGRSQ
jgi:hypothetical protein